MSLKLEQTYTYLAALICASIPFMTYAKAFVNISMICLTLILFVQLNKEKFKKIITQNTLILLFVFLFWIIACSGFNNSFFADFSETRKIAQTLLLLILFSQVSDKKMLIIMFIFGTFLSGLLTSINIITFYLNSFEFLLTGADTNDLFITQRLYLGFFIVISLILSLERFYNSSNENHKAAYLFLIFSFLIFLILISSRSAILIAFMVLITSFIYNSKSIKRTIVLMLTISVFIIMIFNNKTLSKRFLYADDSVRQSFIEKIKTHEPRYDIWKFSAQIFEEQGSYILGLGTYKTQELLIDKYKIMPIKKRSDWFIKRNFNTHNQYLDITLSYGFIGLMIFMVFIKEIIFSNYKNIYSFNLIISLILFLFIENLFHRQLGAFIFSLIIVWAFYLTNTKNEKNISS